MNEWIPYYGRMNELISMDDDQATDVYFWLHPQFSFQDPLNPTPINTGLNPLKGLPYTGGLN